MEKRTVLVTGIGGNVGQGILRNIRALGLGIRLIGTNTKDFSPGNHLCDVTYTVPFSSHPQYIPTLKKIIRREKVNLVIPSTDLEVFYLAGNKKKLKAKVLASDVKTARVYLDKYLTYQYLSAHGIPFVTTWLPKDYDHSEGKIIAKPRKGWGSRGILRGPIKPSALPAGYIIQPWLRGIEITTGVYVNQQGNLHGLITMQRSLSHGTTTECRVVFDYDDAMRSIAEKMIRLGGLVGSFNIQSIVTQAGKIVPFEINCRFSGTNSIRHHFGFQDVKYAIQEHLLNQKPDKPHVVSGVATRILMDVIYPHPAKSPKYHRPRPILH